MPRKPVVSRTIDVACIKAVVADEKKRKIVDKEYTIYKKCRSEKLYLIACQESEQDENIKVLRIVNIQMRKMFCSQPIQKFINESDKTYLN